MIVSKTKEVKLRQTVNGLVPGYATMWRNPDSHPGTGILNILCFLRDDLIKHNTIIVYNINSSCKKHVQHKGGKTIDEYEDRGHPK